MERDYRSLRQEVKNDLERLYPGAVLLTVKQAAKVYGYTDIDALKRALSDIRVKGEKRWVFYIGDLASDLARRRYGSGATRE